MFGNWTPLIWLAATLAPLFFMKRWINRHIQGLGLLLVGDNEAAMFLYFVLLLPGILIHELSHWLAAGCWGCGRERYRFGLPRCEAIKCAWDR